MYFGLWWVVDSPESKFPFPSLDLTLWDLWLGLWTGTRACQFKISFRDLIVLMADGDSGVVGDDSLVQRQNSLVSSLQPTNLQ